MGLRGGESGRETKGEVEKAKEKERERKLDSVGQEKWVGDGKMRGEKSSIACIIERIRS